LSKCHKCLIFNLQKNEGKILWLWKFHHTYRIAMRVQKCQKYFFKLANIDFLKIFFWKSPVFSDFQKKIENVPKIIFSIFWHFCTRITILYMWWNFHSHSIFPLYIFSKLNIFWKTYTQLCHRVRDTEGAIYLLSYICFKSYQGIVLNQKESYSRNSQGMARLMEP